MKCGKIVGIGNTARVFEWGDDRVLKLFYPGYPNDAVEKEYHNALLIKDMIFNKARIYELISYEDKKGIIYERVEGESLQDWVMRTGDLQGCAVTMAKLHKSILQNSVSKASNYKDFLKVHLTNAISDLKERDEYLQQINHLPDGDTLCHGDFHPGNILINRSDGIVIDFMNICRGHYLYDVARTVFLIQFTPVPQGTKDKDMMLQYKKTLADLYLIQMNITREMIQEYLSIIMVIRKSECPSM